MGETLGVAKHMLGSLILGDPGHAAWGVVSSKGSSMSLNFARVGLAAVAVAAGLGVATAQQAPTLLGSQDAWEAYKNNDGRGAVCWATRYGLA